MYKYRADTRHTSANNAGNKTHCDICNSKAARKARSKKEHTTEEAAVPAEADANADQDQAQASAEPASSAPTSHKDGTTAQPPITSNQPTNQSTMMSYVVCGRMHCTFHVCLCVCVSETLMRCTYSHNSPADTR